eukprot:Tamp_02365.p1 GENE.Tamp_02365~~Tamp_02365.p1  ORF type:complete len:271 (-),score=40.82 Tamp_02365:1235-2047(-)
MGLALRASTPGAQGEGLPNHLFLVTTGGSENTPEKPNTGSTMPSSALQSYQTSEDAPLGAGPGRGPDSASASRGGPVNVTADVLAAHSNSSITPPPPVPAAGILRKFVLTSQLQLQGGSQQGGGGREPEMTPEDTQELASLQATLQRAAQEQAAAEAGIEAVLKRLPADESLLFFYGQGCNFTNRVLPEIRCLEAKLGRRVTPLETWNNTANAARYREVGGPDLCGGVPFFFNTKTGIPPHHARTFMRVMLCWVVACLCVCARTPKQWRM